MSYENLKPFQSVEEAKTKGRRGGIASGKARRKKKALREILRELLMMKMPDGGSGTYAEAICLSQLKKAATGDTAAFRAIFDRIEGRPFESTRVEIEDKTRKVEVCLSPEEVCDQLIAQHQADKKSGRKESPYFMR